LTPDQVQQKWEGWVEKIMLDVLRLNRDWLMWTDMAPTLRRAGGDLVFLGHYAQMYIDSQAMMVRRLVNVDNQSVSLGRLLKELADRPDVTTRVRYVGRYPPVGHEGAGREFDRDWNDGKGRLLTQKPLDDLAELQRAAQLVKKLADRTVAHLDTRGLDVNVTFGDLDSARETLTETFRRYATLVTGRYPGHCYPSLTDWKAPFRAGLPFGELDPDRPVST
jgi:hypothetical protein